MEGVTKGKMAQVAPAYMVQVEKGQGLYPETASSILPFLNCSPITADAIASVASSFFSLLVNSEYNTFSITLL